MSREKKRNFENPRWMIQILRNFAIAFGFISFFVAIWTHLENGCRCISFSQKAKSCNLMRLRFPRSSLLFFSSASLFICNFYQLFVAHMCHNSQLSQLTPWNPTADALQLFNRLPFGPSFPLPFSLSLGSKFHENSTVFIRNCILNASQLPQLPQVATGNCCGFCTFVYVEKHKLNKRRCWWQKKIVNPKRKRKQ